MRKGLWITLLLAGCVIVVPPNLGNAIVDLVASPGSSPSASPPSLVFQIPHSSGDYSSPVPDTINIYLPLKGAQQ